MEERENRRLAYDTLQMKPTGGIPTGLFHVMEHSVIERLAGTEPGSYKKGPHGIYCKMLRQVGVSMVDQYLGGQSLDHGGSRL